MFAFGSCKAVFLQDDSPSPALEMTHSNENGARAEANPKLGVILTKLVRELKYQAPAYDGTRPALEAAMVEYALGSGVPYESEFARRYFDVGLTFACVRLLNPSMALVPSFRGLTYAQTYSTNYACIGLLSLPPLCRETTYSHLHLAGQLHRRRRGRNPGPSQLSDTLPQGGASAICSAGALRRVATGHVDALRTPRGQFHRAIVAAIYQLHPSGEARRVPRPTALQRGKRVARLHPRKDWSARGLCVLHLPEGPVPGYRSVYARGTGYDDIHCLLE